VYIHCAGGVGRAPTLAAAYFITQGMTLDEALALIRRTRPFIHIMPAQMDQLRQFEVSQREKASV
jgi:protein-tyrosine phosphatase